MPSSDIKVADAIVPKPVTFVACLFAPFLATVFFIVSAFRKDFLSDAVSVDYFSLQQDFLGGVFISASIAEVFNRMLDFAVWGVIAALFMIILWLIDAARVAVHNHQAVTGFRNFSLSDSTWHGRFIVMAVIRVVLVFMITYLLVLILVRIVPGISFAAHEIVRDGFAPNRIGQLALQNFYLWLVQLSCIVAIKILKITPVD